MDKSCDIFLLQRRTNFIGSDHLISHVKYYLTVKNVQYIEPSVARLHYNYWSLLAYG